jgi:hypothetical protein
MTHDQHNPMTDFERLLQSTFDAERAGVFNETPVDAANLMSERSGASRGSWMRFARIAVPLAACLAVAFGVGQVLRSTPPTGPGPSMTRALADSQPAGCSTSLTLYQDCVTGPGGGSLSPECACLDQDADGDVDFADFGLLQRAAGMSNG